MPRSGREGWGRRDGTLRAMGEDRMGAGLDTLCDGPATVRGRRVAALAKQAAVTAILVPVSEFLDRPKAMVVALPDVGCPHDTLAATTAQVRRKLRQWAPRSSSATART